MVDAADREKIEASRNELHNLLDKPQLQGIPVRDLLLIFFFFFKKHQKLVVLQQALDDQDPVTVTSSH